MNGADAPGAETMADEFMSALDPNALKSPDPNPWTPWLVGGAASGLLVLASVLIMFGLGLFDRHSATDPEGNLVAAAIAFVGVVIGAAVTLIGTVVKFSIDDRNVRLASIESTRNYLLALEAEQRNRLDSSHNHALTLEAEQRNRIQAAISAVQLLGDGSTDASPAKINGAVLALVSLGELELAIALVRLLWPDQKITDEVADVVLVASMLSDSDAVLKSAAATVLVHAHRIDQGDHHIWPIAHDWLCDAPLSARIGLAAGAARWLETSLELHPNRAPSAPAAVLFHALNDPSDMVRGVAGEALQPLADNVADTYWAATSHGGKISLAEIHARLDLCRPHWAETRASIDAMERVTRAVARNRACGGIPDGLDESIDR